MRCLPACSEFKKLVFVAAGKNFLFKFLQPVEVIDKTMPDAGHFRPEMLRSCFYKLFSGPFAHSLLKIAQGGNGVTGSSAAISDFCQGFFYLLLNDFESSDTDFTRLPVLRKIGDVIENSREDTGMSLFFSDKIFKIIFKIRKQSGTFAVQVRDEKLVLM